MVDIRSASKDDIGLINTLAKEIFDYTYGPILSPEQVEFMFDMMYAPHNIEKQMDCGHRYYIAQRGGVPVGYVSILELSKSHYRIEKIYTLPSVHGGGVGRALFNFACDNVKASSSGGECLLELNVNRHNERAIRFYTKMGMRADRRTDEHVGNGFYANDFVMAINL